MYDCILVDFSPFFLHFYNDGDYRKFQPQLVQVYLYTFTGLHDKAGNHLTQFMGVLLK